MREMFERLGFTPSAAASLEGNDRGINTLEEVVQSISFGVQGGDLWTYDCWRSRAGQPRTSGC
jgi:hypothetical protein